MQFIKRETMNMPISTTLTLTKTVTKLEHHLLDVQYTMAYCLTITYQKKNSKFILRSYDDLWFIDIVRTFKKLEIYPVRDKLK